MSRRESKIYNVIIAILVILIIIAGIVLFLKRRPIKKQVEKPQENAYYINLIGEREMNLYVGENYDEPGYEAVDQDNKIVTDLVVVINNVNKNKVGTYDVIYEINTDLASARETRTVNVIEKPKNNQGTTTKKNNQTKTTTTTKKASTIEFKLLGNTTMQLAINAPFNDPGFVATDGNTDIKKYVKASGMVNTTKAGTYEVTYILNYKNEKRTLKRTVIVVSSNVQTGNNYTTKITPSVLTKDNVLITIQSSSSNFAYFQDPAKNKVTKSTLEYAVKTNGKYTFYMYDKSGKSEKIEVEVKNIDKTAPTGSCTSVISGNTTTYTINATDANGIAKYMHNNVQYNKTFTVNQKEEDGIVVVYDIVGNYSSITCKSEYASIDAGNKATIAHYNSSTLKYWIEKPTSNYAVTHIWVKDAYNQMKTAVPATFGTLATAETILNKEIKNNGYASKGLFAINASAIVSDTYNTGYINAISNWRNTSTTPIVIVNGNVLRNFTNQKIYVDGKSVGGLKKNGYLESYAFTSASDTTTNTKTASKIVSDGVKYTFGLSPVLVSNSKAVSTETDNNLRQAICQIDRNNFLVISSTSSDRYAGGLSFKTMSRYMVDSGCKTGFNLDGGLSISTFYKMNSSYINKINNATREVVDILYFVEK